MKITCGAKVMPKMLYQNCLLNILFSDFADNLGMDTYVFDIIVMIYSENNIIVQTTQHNFQRKSNIRKTCVKRTL